MLDDSDAPSSGSENRREPREKPYPYLPHVIVNPEGDQRIAGFVRNVSRKGFSAEFEEGFPFAEGDVLDVRVGYQRAWAKVVWVETVFGSIKVVGFELHPEEFLDTAMENQGT